LVAFGNFSIGLDAFAPELYKDYEWPSGADLDFSNFVYILSIPGRV
jgi:hypothetical protein